MENVLLANPWFPLQAYIFRPKGRGITPKLLLKNYKANFSKPINKAEIVPAT